jgi:hypothetical protein
MTNAPCTRTSLVDAHFAGTISVADEGEMRRHLLDGCATCHFRYTRLAMVAKLQPSATKAEDRIARGLGLGGRPGTSPWAAILGVVAACAVLAMVLVGRKNGPDQFAARGPASATGDLRIFRVRPGAPGELVTDRIAATDELAFAYRNGTGKKHLFIFGVDEHRHVYWYWPAWRNATEQPPAPVATGDGLFHEIEDAVGHQYDGTRLELYGLFTDRPWPLREVEAVVGRAAPGAPLSFDDGVATVQHLLVTH